MNYIFRDKGKVRDVLRTFAKLAVADRILEMRYGVRIELIPINPDKYSKN